MLLPFADEYLPATHRSQTGPPLSPLYPTLHVQLLMCVDRGGDIVLFGHWFAMPVQHHCPASHTLQAVLLTPNRPRSQ